MTTNTLTPPVTPPVPGSPAPSDPALGTPRRSLRRRRKAADDEADRGIVSTGDWRLAHVRITMRTLQGLLFAGLVICGLGPMLWLLKSALTPTQDTLRQPLALFPHGIDWANLVDAWTQVNVGVYVWNTLALALGCWFVQILVATTAGYALSVLRPRYGRALMGLVLGTLFVPSIVLLVPLYLTILHPPLLHTSMINTFWAVWLPSGASAFNVLIVARFFDSLPREVFEAARTDGAGPFRLFWSIVLPMSKPIIGVVSVFAVIASFNDFLWPFLVLPNTALQPLSVRLPSIETTTDLGVFLAALTIATFIPVVLFLVMQRFFLHGAGMQGAVKG
ncbi:carbohydrate ABC transporter permease [Frondihabitans sp. PAMC 28766]|uniref:carbohydrate ABC transporter permease n=1 Tax=Frondihabitans sp. PAMC 28766 TaxID=1795630 RepID=UPI0009EA8732|nr:carbohydrate ABC transporter permease [Frondihabitans sp. PAMC 28766]